MVRSPNQQRETTTTRHQRHAPRLCYDFHTCFLSPGVKTGFWSRCGSSAWYSSLSCYWLNQTRSSSLRTEFSRSQRSIGTFKKWLNVHMGYIHLFAWLSSQNPHVFPQCIRNNDHFLDRLFLQGELWRWHLPGSKWLQATSGMGSTCNSKYYNTRTIHVHVHLSWSSMWTYTNNNNKSLILNIRYCTLYPSRSRSRVHAPSSLVPPKVQI